MAVKNKRQIVKAVCCRSYTGEEGRMRPGMRFECTLSRLEVLEKKQLAKGVEITKAIIGKGKTKADKPMAKKPVEKKVETKKTKGKGSGKKASKAKK